MPPPPAIDLRLLRRTVRGAVPAASAAPAGTRVWKATLSDGTAVAVKRFPEGAVPDPLEVEPPVLRGLFRAGCPVPEVHLVDLRLRLMVTAWAGDRTMDDLCQEADGEAATRAALETAEGLARIEAAMAGAARPADATLLRPDGEAEGSGMLRAALCGAASLAADGRVRPEVREGLARLAESIRRAPRSVGCLDYNARNVVAGPEGVRFVDFSCVGWDWPERRLVQYVTGLGAHRPGGRLVSPLTPGLVARYAEVRRGPDPGADAASVARAVDAHDLVFHLALLDRIDRARRFPGRPESALLSRAWDGMAARVEQARRHLGRPLSGDPGLAELRGLFRIGG
jgi:hypothetical protein